jgi:hypothetical protein
MLAGFGLWQIDHPVGRSVTFLTFALSGAAAEGDGIILGIGELRVRADAGADPAAPHRVAAEVARPARPGRALRALTVPRDGG